ncbi:MAG TPA: DUF262 domain-containing protein [Kofleriaceae bacterium]|nr:DUF262 domain-containing protein [Kofleriaceae bacterium]
MAAVAASIQSRPEARVFRVEELIAHARVGHIRVPRFQRAFKWEREDVRKLLDSIWRGYPIGTLLLWSKVGPAGPVTLGDLRFEVNEQSSAWFVVDGQQRIVSLVSTLLSGGARAEKFDLYFDLEKGTEKDPIVPPGRSGPRPTYLPLNRVVDSEELLAWIDENRAALAPEQVRLALRVGKVLREYELPAYVVHVDDEAVVREIFERTNTTGKALEASDVFHALHAPVGPQPALHLKDVIERLRARLLGELDEDQVLRGLLAIERKDLTGDLQRQLVTVDIPSAIERLEHALDRVFGFLAQDAGVPHLRLLPYQSPLTTLSAYFDRFPTPSARARRLLTRWLWRGAMTGELRGDSEGIRVALEAVHAGRSDEEVARGVLATVSTQRPEVKAGEPFNLRWARSKLSVIALVELRPHHLRTGVPLDITALLESSDEAVPQIMTHRPAAAPADRAAVFSSVGNRIVHPSVDDESVLSMLLAAVRAQPSPGAVVSPHVLASHAITAEMTRALQETDRVRFLELRRDQIEAATARLIDRHAEWSYSDRPSIAALIEEED